MLVGILNISDPQFSDNSTDILNVLFNFQHVQEKYWNRFCVYKYNADVGDGYVWRMILQQHWLGGVLGGFAHWLGIRFGFSKIRFLFIYWDHMSWFFIGFWKDIIMKSFRSTEKVHCRSFEKVALQSKNSQIGLDSGRACEDNFLKVALVIAIRRTKWMTLITVRVRI